MFMLHNFYENVLNKSAAALGVLKLHDLKKPLVARVMRFASPEGRLF